MEYLVGIDLGSTSLKAVIYDKSGKAVAAGSRPTERFNPSTEHPEWTVWQPEQISGSIQLMAEGTSTTPRVARDRDLAAAPEAWDTVSGMSLGDWQAPARKTPSVAVFNGPSLGCSSRKNPSAP